MNPAPAIENLVRTYQALASTLDGVEHFQFEGGVATVCALRHPLGNFAMFWPETPINMDAVAPLRRVAWFHLYLISEGFDSRLVPGFRPSYELVVMDSHGVSDDAAYAPIRFASSMRERQAVARFMTRQFFSGASRQLVEQIAESTTLATGLQLAAFQSGLLKRLEAAVMLHDTEQRLGLYNLCVDAPLRGGGRGSEIVRRVLAHAGRQAQVVTLQCDPRLEKWYERFGFRRVAMVRAWKPEG